jgi:ribose transport system ATP-binding protein
VFQKAPVSANKAREDVHLKTDAAEKALIVEGIVKRYGPTIALDHASFAIEAGTVHALLGENGAGKSTLVKILSGLVKPDSGRLSIFGVRTRIKSPRSAHALGIRTAFQEISMVPDLSVTRNFLLMEEPLNTLGMVSQHRCEEYVVAELSRVGLHGIDPRVNVADLDLPTRQKVEIARSASHKPRLLLLDEPTASLSKHDVQWLAGLIDSCKADGVTVVLITHRMQEVRELCSSLSVLRNGKCVSTAHISALSDEEIIEAVIGRSLGAVFPSKIASRGPANGTPSVLSAKGMHVGNAVKDVNLDLAAGEILGISGLQGMGQRELFLALYGAVKIDAGTVSLDGKPAHFRSPADAVAAGIGLVPEDRKSEGLFLEFSGRQNLALPGIRRFVKFGLVEQLKEMRAVMAGLSRVQVHPRAASQPATSFSGGNQQKMVIAKWLVARSRILLLYDPTRGVDIGTKAEIYRLINNFVQTGGTVLLYSSETPELVNLCAKVLVLYRGRVSERLAGDAVTETRIMRAALAKGRAGAEDMMDL